MIDSSNRHRSSSARGRNSTIPYNRSRRAAASAARPPVARCTRYPRPSRACATSAALSPFSWTRRIDRIARLDSTSRVYKARVIALEKVGYRYRTDAPAVLEGIDLEVREGLILCAVGPNGAGKTTLLRLIGGLIAPGSGTVKVLGVDPAREPRRRLARRLCYLPQR